MKTYQNGGLFQLLWMIYSQNVLRECGTCWKNGTCLKAGWQTIGKCPFGWGDECPTVNLGTAAVVMRHGQRSKERKTRRQAAQLNYICSEGWKGPISYIENSASKPLMGLLTICHRPAQIESSGPI